MRGYDYETNGYHRALQDEYEDEYYDQDEYEEEGSGAGEEYVEEDPPEGQKEILELREQLKEQIRRKALTAGSNAASRSSSSRDRVPPTRDKFGSFFGPSKPVISKRVIEERKSLKELHSTIARDPRPPGRDVPSSSKVQSKGNGLQHKTKIVNEAKKKAEALKDNRDYSFLLSDDADLSPSPKGKPAARPSLNQNADREVMRSAVKSKASTSEPVRLSNGYGSKNTLPTQRHAEAKIDSMRKDALSNRERVISRDKEKMRSTIRNGSNQPSASKTTSQKLPSKGSVATRHLSKDVNDSSLRKSSVPSRHHLPEVGRQQSSQSQRMPSSGHRPQHPSHDQRPHQSVQQRAEQSLQSQRPQLMSQGQRSQQSLQSQRMQQAMQSQRQHQTSLQKSQPPQNHRPQSQSYRPQTLQGQRPISSQGQYSEQRRARPNDRVKLVERQIRPPSKPMPSRPISSNGIRDDHAKKRPVVKRRFDDDDDDDEDPLAMIRSMFRYDPSKYAGRDDDDSDMEADFATIEREEERSSRIARQEDDEQLRLIEEEERREQERKRRKMARGR